MTEEEKRIVKKLQGIINDTPYPGEKATALNVLKKYCLKHGITLDQLETDEEKVFDYEIVDKSNTGGVLLLSIVFWTLKRHKKPWHDERMLSFRYNCRSKQSVRLYKIKTTTEIFLEIISEFEVYFRAYKKQVRNYLRDMKIEFTRAFLDAHDLLLPSDEFKPKRIGEEKLEDDIKRFWEAAAYRETLSRVEHVTVHKQIPHTSNGNKDG